MNILVTGATGLIGAHLVRELVQRGHRVCGVTRSVVPVQVIEGVQWCSLDLSAPDWHELPPSADVVVHLAQSEHYRSFPEHATDVFNVNVSSTARLLDWARGAGVRQFILASSGGVAQKSAGAMSHYAATKRSAELIAESYSRLFSVLVLRFFFVYGDGQKPWMLVPRLMQTIKSGGEIALAGADGPRLNPVYVDDAVRAIWRGIEQNASGTIEIAGPQILTVRAISDILAARLGRPARYVTSGDSAEDLTGDISLMSSQLAPPQRNFAEGVAKMALSAANRIE